MDLICTRCDGLGEERWQKKDILPQHNVYGWHTTFDLAYYARRCEACDGTGFRPSGTSVPTVSPTQQQNR